MDDKFVGNRVHRGPPPPPTARSSRPFQFRPPPPRSSDQPSSHWTLFNSSGGDNSTPTNFSDGFLPIDKRARRGLFQPPAGPGAAAALPTSPNLQRHESALSTTRSSSGASSDNLNLSDYISRRVEEEIEAMGGSGMVARWR